MKQGMQTALVRLDRKGRVVLPKRIRDKAGINVSDVLFVYTFEKLVFLGRAEINNKPVREALKNAAVGIDSKKTVQRYLCI